jgi:hypothetical protein
VAQEMGWDVKRVIRYAEPPLRERAYVAQCAREVQLHHARGSETLEIVVCNSLGLKPDDLNWDSSHVDGQWLVQLDAPGNSEQAQWSYEPAGKTVNPLNPAARTLMGLEPTRDMHSATSRESTIIVDTTSGYAQPKIESNTRSETEDSPIAPVKLSAVPELFEMEEPEVVAPVIETGHEPAQVPPKKTRKGRAKVPSWDEILFGANSTED